MGDPLGRQVLAAPEPTVDGRRREPQGGAALSWS